MRIPNKVVVCGLACSMLAGFSSCSKHENEVTPAALSTTAGVKVVDGRLEFSDFQAYKQTLDMLKSKTDAELALWEKSVNFVSLRSSAGEATEALKAEFRFPSAYAAIINPKGEYKVGDKLYWYHAGEKQEFNTLADLQAAHQGLNAPHTSLAAGYKVIDTKTKDGAPVTAGSRQYQNNNSGVDARHQYQFFLWNDRGSERKIVYETYVYTDQNPYNYQYHSVLAMNMKLEYWSRTGWRKAGETRVVNAQLDGVATAYSGSTQTPLPSNSGSQIYVRHNSTVNYDTNIWLSDSWAFSANVYNTSDIYWNYTVNGSISSWVTSDAAHTYTVSGYNLW